MLDRALHHLARVSVSRCLVEQANKQVTTTRELIAGSNQLLAAKAAYTIATRTPTT